MSRLSGKWENLKIGDPRVCQSVQPGFACGDKDVTRGVPHLRMNNITSNGFADFTVVRRIPKDVAESKNRWLESGDVLFCNTNSTELVGKTCLFEGWNEPCAFSNHLTRLRVNTQHILAQWLMLSLRQLWLSKFFATHCTEFIGQSAFNKDQLQEIRIPVPPLEEQRRIVSRIEALTRRADEARRLRQAALTEAETFMTTALRQEFDRIEQSDSIKEMPFDDAVTRLQPQAGKLKTDDYQESGALPIVDQGQQLIVAYTDQAEKQFQGPLPVVVFGDHTRTVKYIDFPFAVGADGTVLLCPTGEFSAAYLAYWLQSRKLHALGYSRHFKLVRELSFFFPPSSDQQRSVTLLDSLRAKTTELQRIQHEAETELNAFTPALLAKAFRGDL